MEKIGSIATENFIKAIYKFEQGVGMDTKPGSIARELGITNAAATDMARKLAMKNLINYEKYKELKLTSTGKKMALGIIRKHRLWETFLHRVFGLTMHEIHREAELLEHLTSDFLTEKISLFLGNPTTDPHGDPIPSDQGVVPSDDNSVILSSAESEREYEISRLSGSDKEFFEFCHSNHLGIGSSLIVKKQYHKNRMTEIEIDNARLLLNAELANTIFVKESLKERQYR
jgi:DtxR family Mn-dependent transcriptional regulator